ncbi:MAG: MATE family efflux transporter [Lachnospiraceae bacterium]
MTWKRKERLCGNAPWNKDKKEQYATKHERLTNAPVEPLILRLAVPTIVTMLISSIYNLADTYFAGILGKEATAAIGVTFSLLTMLQAFSFFIGQGAGNYIARLLGAKKQEEAERLVSVAFFTVLAFGTLFAVLGAVFTEPLVRLLGATETIFPLAVGYTRALLVGIPFLMASFVMNNLLRFQGSAFYGMLGIGMGSLLNIALDPVFMFGMKLGVAGAAVATVVSQVIGFVILVLMCNFGRNNLRIRLKQFRPSVAIYKEIVRGGLPALCRQGLASVATLSLNWCIKPYGDAAIAAFSIVARLTGFAASALMGFGQGFQPVCGFNYGAGRYDRVKRGYFFCLKVSVFFMTVLGVGGFVFANQLSMLFQKEDAAVVELATRALRFQCITFPLIAVIIMTNMLTQTMGFAVSATILSIARQGLFFLPVLLALSYIAGMSGIFLAQPVADAISFVLALYLAQKTVRLLKRETAEKENS